MVALAPINTGRMRHHEDTQVIRNAAEVGEPVPRFTFLTSRSKINVRVEGWADRREKPQ
jgi:hypothetical protein